MLSRVSATIAIVSFRVFHHHKEKPDTLWLTHYFFFPLPHSALKGLLSTFCLRRLAYSGHSIEMESLNMGSSGICIIHTQRFVFKVHPSMLQQVSALHCFHGWILFHCTDFVYSSIDGYFHLSSIINSAVNNIYVQVFVWTPISCPFGYTPSSGIAGSYDNTVFNFRRSAELLCTVAAPLYFPTGSAWESQLLHILTDAGCFPLFWSQPSQWVWAGISLWFYFVLT